MASDRSPTPGRRSVWAVVVALAAVLWLGVALGFIEPRGQVQRFADGSTLELRGWTIAPHSSFVDGNFWQRAMLAARWDVPGWGGYRASHPNAARLALWFRGSRLDDPQFTPAVWLDQHGCRIRTERFHSTLGSPEPVQNEFELARLPRGWRATPELQWKAATVRVQWNVNPTGPPTTSWPTGSSYGVVGCDVFPRRDPGPLTYAVISGNPGEPPARFEIPNPDGSTTYPHWTAPSCPVIPLDGDSRFTLARLEHSPPNQDTWQWSTATFRYSGPLRDRQSWRPERVQVSDATGNELVTEVLEFGALPSIDFAALCRRESAWKLKVRFAHVNPASVPPDSVWTVLNVAVPESKGTLYSRRSSADADATLRLDEICRFGESLHANEREPRIDLDLHLTAASRQGCQLTLIRATDARGRSVLTEPRAATYSRPGDGAGYTQPRYVAGTDPQAMSVSLSVPPFTRRLNLEFAIHRTPTVEFLVKP